MTPEERAQKILQRAAQVIGELQLQLIIQTVDLEDAKKPPTPEEA